MGESLDSGALSKGGGWPAWWIDRAARAFGPPVSSTLGQRGLGFGGLWNLRGRGWGVGVGGSGISGLGVFRVFRNCGISRFEGLGFGAWGLQGLQYLWDLQGFVVFVGIDVKGLGFGVWGTGSRREFRSRKVSFGLG